MVDNDFNKYLRQNHPGSKVKEIKYQNSIRKPNSGLTMIFRHDIIILRLLAL